MAKGARDGQAAGQPQVAALITRCDALTVESRLRLAALLAVRGHPVAYRPGEVAGLVLTLDPDTRAVVGRAVGDGLGRDALASLAPCRLDAVFPAIEGRAGGPAAHGAPGRLLGILEQHAALRWATLGGYTIGDISGWSGVGPAMTATLLGLVIEASLGFLAKDAEDAEEAGGSRVGPVAGVASDLALLFAYDEGRPVKSGGLRSAIQRLAGSSSPVAVQAAAQRILQPLGPPGRPATVFVAAEEALGAIGDIRDRVVFEQGVLRLDDRPTLAQLGTDLNIGIERVRQLRSRAEQRVRSVLRDGPAEQRDSVAALAAEIGSALPRAVVDDMLEARGLPGQHDPRTQFVLWAAGPYRPVVGYPAWLSTDHDGLVATTRRLLAEDGGVRPVAHVVKELERLGMRADVAARWVAEQPVLVLDDLAVLTTGAPADVAERVLSAAGRAMTSDDLCGLVAVPGDGARLSAAAASMRDGLRRDRRFVEVGPDRYELAEWGAEPYHDEPVATATGEPGDWGRAHDGSWWLRVVVEGDLLGGAGASVAAGLIECLGVRPGARRAFSTRYGPVVLTHAAAGPTRGSLRPIGLATGAEVGDTLVLRFGPDDSTATVELVRATAAAG